MHPRAELFVLASAVVSHLAMGARATKAPFAIQGFGKIVDMHAQVHVTVRARLVD